MNCFHLKCHFLDQLLKQACFFGWALNLLHFLLWQKLANFTLFAIWQPCLLSRLKFKMLREKRTVAYFKANRLFRQGGKRTGRRWATQGAARAPIEIE